MMENFTPLASFVGGTLIGLSAVVLMLLNGRVAGISGITAGMLPRAGLLTDRGWRIAFLVGLILAPLAIMLASGARLIITFVAPTWIMIFAGLLVGFGTVLGNGCTSGHGVCGIARLSTRSIVATAVFMAAAFMTTYIVRHIVVGG